VTKLQSKTRLERKSAEWLCHLDERIMERLDEEEGPLTPWMISEDLGAPSQMRVDERCRVLARAGFIQISHRFALDDQFSLTGWGRLYLDGDVDADLREPLPAPRPPEAVRPGKYAGFG